MYVIQDFFQNVKNSLNELFHLQIGFVIVVFIIIQYYVDYSLKVLYDVMHETENFSVDFCFNVCNNAGS